MDIWIISGLEYTNSIINKLNKYFFIETNSQGEIVGNFQSHSDKKISVKILLKVFDINNNSLKPYIIQPQN